MSKLKCQHNRRVLVFRNAGEQAKTLHRNDGTRCDSQYVVVYKAVYNPINFRDHDDTTTNTHALGPVVGVGEINDIAEKIAKSQSTWHAKKRMKK